MSNQKIISEFERLLAYIKNETENLTDKKEISKNNFRTRQISNVIILLKKFPKKINTKNLNEVGEIRGIGKSSIERIKEILEKGKLSELGSFVDTKKAKKKSIKELEEIIGVGHAKAKEFYEQGITSIKMLRSKIKKKEIEVNDKVLLGLKYHGVFEENIPRKEIDTVYKLLKKIVTKMNKDYKYTKNNQYCFEICGSYRREKLTSGDMDILLTKFLLKWILYLIRNYLVRLKKVTKKL